MQMCGVCFFSFCFCEIDTLKVKINQKSWGLLPVFFLLQHFNSRSCQLVLGAGALQVVGLKTITTKNLGTHQHWTRHFYLVLFDSEWHCCVCVCSISIPLPAAGGSLHSHHQSTFWDQATAQTVQCSQTLWPHHEGNLKNHFEFISRSLVWSLEVVFCFAGLQRSHRRNLC